MISATDFRKWIVTIMYKKKQKRKKIDEEPLRRLMCHSDYTAKKWYLRDSLTDQAAEAAEQIKSFTKPSPKKNAPECDEQEDQAECSPSKRPLSEEEHQAVKEVFQPEIEKHSPIRKKVVMAKMREHPILMKALTSPEKVTDRVRYLQEKQPTIDPFKLPDDSPGGRTARYVYGETTSGHGSLQSARLDWDEEDTKLIDEALSKYEKCPRNPEITKIFSSTPQLQQILEDNSFDRIRNKVKNIFQKRRPKRRK